MGSSVFQAIRFLLPTDPGLMGWFDKGGLSETQEGISWHMTKTGSGKMGSCLFSSLDSFLCCQKLC